MQACPGLRQLVLVGDPCQLPSPAGPQLAAGAGPGYARSLYQLAQVASRAQPLLLDTQYHRQPALSRALSAAFYGGKVGGHRVLGLGGQELLLTYAQAV